jgi:serine phosphatase RsbU (regulator of sigma subunit)
LIVELEEEVEKIIMTMPLNERPVEWHRYDELKRKKDSIILLAEQKANSIIVSANNQLKDSFALFKSVKGSASTVKNLDDLQKDIHLLIPEASYFRNQNKIKDYETKINKYRKKEELSKRDSIDYLESITGLNEEILKSAKLKLEIDKLNAKTREDSLVIQQKESKIVEMEREIEVARYELNLKNLEIQKKNTAIFSMVIISVLMVILFISLYRNLKRKKKNIVLLSKRNKVIALQKAEIEAKNKKIILQRDIANQHKQELLDSINYAKKIQMAVLPSEKEISSILPEHFIFFKPRDIVIGDFFWIKQIKNFVIIAAVDCTGHGVPGAFMSLLGTTFLNEIVSVRNLDNAGDILNRLRNKVKKSLHQTGEYGENSDGMDISFCIIDKETLTLEYAGAFNPLLIIRNGSEGEQEIIELKADRQPISIHPIEKKFSNQKVQLKRNDCIYCFTDGFSDQFGGHKGKKLKSKVFKTLLASISNEPMNRQKTILDEKFIKWKGDFEQIDDVLIIGIRIKDLN